MANGTVGFFHSCEHSLNGYSIKGICEYYNVHAMHAMSAVGAFNIVYTTDLIKIKLNGVLQKALSTQCRSVLV